MPLELVLLLVVAGVLPLLQRVLAAAQEHTQNAPRVRPPGTPARTNAVPSVAPPLPPLPERQAPDSTMTFDAPPALELAPPLSPAPAPSPRRGTPRWTLARGLRDRHGIRRAFVMAAALGPCRAVAPYDGPAGR